MWSVRGPQGLLGCLAAALLSATLPARAETCLKDHHEVKYPGGSAKLRDYLCTFSQGADTKRIRVTFHRLSEVMAGNLIMGEPLPELDAIIGKAEVIRNDVFAETASLFRSFGSSEVSDRRPGGETWELKAETPPVTGAGSPGSAAPVPRPRKSKLWYLVRPSTYHGNIVVPGADHTLLKTDRWPEGFRNYYLACPEKDYIACTIIWRHVGASELDGIERETAAQEARDRASWDSDSPASSEADIPEPNDYRKHFPLFRHLTRKGWPEDFLTVMGDAGNCDGVFLFFHVPRTLMLDVAVMENSGRSDLVLNDLLGTRQGDSGLRATTDSDARPSLPSEALGMTPMPLAAGMRLVVPLRISFAGQAAEWIDIAWPKPATANATFQAIQSLPAGKRLSSTLGNEGGGKIVKARESFLPPERPSPRDYVYGPEVDVSGLVVGGVRSSFESTSANFLNMTVESGGYSCPILYSWDGTDWVRHGKVIHAAQDRANQETEVVSVRPGTLRFMLSEEEPEVSYIDGMEMRLTMAGGRQIALAPRQPELAAIDERTLRILAYRSEIIEFVLPADVPAESIERSELAITGYYRRYRTGGPGVARLQAINPIDLDP